jgi:hypothetical protein
VGLEQEYRKHAADSFDLAGRRQTSADKSHLLLMAEAWLDLADRLAKPSRASRLHPHTVKLIRLYLQIVG